MTARYHSITCENPCPGWGCSCWCHPCRDLPDEEGDDDESR